MKLIHGRECWRCGADIPPHKHVSATCCDNPDCKRQRVKENNAKRKAARKEWGQRPENAAKVLDRYRNRSDAQKRIDRDKSARVARQNQALSPAMGRDYYRPWTPDEDAVLLNPNLSRMERAWMLNRSMSSINNRRYNIRIGKNTQTASEMWTEDEVSILMQTDLTLAQMAELTGRSVQSVNVKRYKLREHGVAVPMIVVPWAPEEDEILRTTQLTAREIAALLGRTEASITARAQTKGISLAYWDGWWTEEEDAIIMRTDLTRQQMAKLTRRGPEAISSRRLHLKQRGIDVPKIGVCKAGHPYTPENTRIDKRGSRRCQMCVEERNARARARREAEKANKPPKTHCSRGHEYTPDNNYFYSYQAPGRPKPSTVLKCRDCARERNAKRAKNPRRVKINCLDCATYFEGYGTSPYCLRCRSIRDNRKRAPRRLAERRALTVARHADMHCVDCGESIAYAKISTQKYCDSCKRERRNACVRRWYQEQKRCT